MPSYVITNCRRRSHKEVEMTDDSRMLVLGPGTYHLGNSATLEGRWTIEVTEGIEILGQLVVRGQAVLRQGPDEGPEGQERRVETIQPEPIGKLAMSVTEAAELQRTSVLDSSRFGAYGT